MANKSNFFNPEDYNCLMFPTAHPPAWWREKIVSEGNEPEKPVVKRQQKAIQKKTPQVSVEHLIF